MHLTHAIHSEIKSKHRKSISQSCHLCNQPRLTPTIAIHSAYHKCFSFLFRSWHSSVAVARNHRHRRMSRTSIRTQVCICKRSQLPYPRIWFTSFSAKDRSNASVMHGRPEAKPKANLLLWKLHVSTYSYTILYEIFQHCSMWKRKELPYFEKSW